MGVDVRTDSRGLRGAEIADKAPPGVARIAFVGDSITMGWGVAEKETFANQVIEGLVKAGRKVDGFNLGVGNYNTLQELSLFREVGAPLKPDIIVLAYFINDAEPMPSYADNGWLSEHSAAWVVAGYRFDSLFRQFGEARVEYPVVRDTGERRQVEPGDQGAGPAGKGGSAQVHRDGAGKEVLPEGPGEQGIAKDVLGAGEFDEGARRVERRGHGGRGGVAPGQHQQHYRESGQRPGGADVEQLLPVHYRGAQAEEGAEAADGRERGGDGQEVGRRGVDRVASRHDVVSQFVHQEDAEQRQGEGPAAHDDLLGPGEEIGEEPEPREDGPGDALPGGRAIPRLEGGPGTYGADHRDGKEDQVEEPGLLAPRGDGPDQHQLGVTRGAPVVDVGPGGERGAELR